MGGTFDPIHLAHLFVAQAVGQAFQLDKVIFMPSGTPPHKLQPGVSPAEDRYQMTAAAVAGNPLFEVSRFEIERGGVSYTLETMRALQALRPEDEFFFIIGADSVRDLSSWYRWRELLDVTQFVAVNRPGVDLTESLKQLAEAGAPVQRIHTIDLPRLDISSTEIRQRLRMGQTVKYLVPAAVERYIAEHRLYGQDE
jgi:nicotinate-nucleotide adenylyltransferase